MMRMKPAHRRTLLAVAATLALPVAARGATINVGPGESIQMAIDAAVSGDIVAVAAGTFTEDIDFLGKAITVRGSGHASIIQGTGTGPVVTLASGEGSASVLDSFTITGGLADEGGGVMIVSSSPTIARNVIFLNQAAARGSGIHVENSTALIQNNLVLYNHAADFGDPHSIEVVDAAPTIVNNTIVRNDSNGIILRGSSPAIVMNNLITRNGSRGRGRGICDFSDGGSALIQYNLFHRNRKAALLTDGKDFKRIRRAQLRIAPPRLEGNIDGRPNFAARRNPPRLGSRRMEDMSVADFVMKLGLDSMARRRTASDAGNPDPAFNDLDGSRNDIGFTGGPGAAP